MKFFLTILITYSTLFAVHNFKETKYLEALNVEQYKYGTVSFKKDTLILNYTKPTKQTISYYDKKIVIKTDDKISEYGFEEYPKLQYMSILLKSIFQNNYKELKPYFIIKKENNEIVLNAKPVLSDTIVSITIVNVKNKLKFLTINMANKDETHIELLD